MIVNGFKYVCFSDDEVMDTILYCLGKKICEGNRKKLRSLGNELKFSYKIKYISHKDFKPFVRQNMHIFED